MKSSAVGGNAAGEAVCCSVVSAEQGVEGSRAAR